MNRQNKKQFFREGNPLKKQNGGEKRKRNLFFNKPKYRQLGHSLKSKRRTLSTENAFSLKKGFKERILGQKTLFSNHNQYC